MSQRGSNIPACSNDGYSPVGHLHDERYAQKEHSHDLAIENIEGLTTALSMKAHEDHDHDGVYSPEGHTHAELAPSDHDHSAATTTTDGFMSAADKVRLDAVGTNANRNAFIATTDPSPTDGADGDVWYKVEA